MLLSEIGSTVNLVSIVEWMMESETNYDEGLFGGWPCLNLRTGKLVMKDEPSEEFPAIPLSVSHEAYKIMEDFSRGLTRKRQRVALLDALDRRHPFSAFLSAVEDLGIRNEWEEFRFQQVAKQAREWLESVGVDAGRIILGDYGDSFEDA